MMQAFAYRHLVPAKELEVAVLKRPTAAGDDDHSQRESGAGAARRDRAD